MNRLVLAVALLCAGPATAQETCLKPAAPVFPAASTAGTLGQQQLEEHRAARDAYFTAADANLACLDRAIESRMKTLFATGAPMDAELRRLGTDHETASRERAVTYERFLRLCLAWEDAKHTPFPGGCAVAR
jgi:hypothetical protein